MNTRKKYTKEFKLDAINLVLEQGYTRAEAAKSLEINPQMLGRWVKERQQDDGQAFRGNGKMTAEQTEIKKLKAQVKQLEMEKEILKNCLQFYLSHLIRNTRIAILNSQAAYQWSSAFW